MAVQTRKPARSRIDALLVERGLVESRQQARAALMAGDIRVDGAMVTKPGVGVDPVGLTCLDAGASTGGFTDCLLQHGALRVYAVDVGYGVLDYGLRQDERVVVMERTNARDLDPLPERCDLATVDVSFIGLEKVLPGVCRSLRPGAEVVALVKPQFQARREEVGKKGVVKDVQVHVAVIGRVVAWTSQHDLRLLNLTTSPLLGPAGNREFFLHLRYQPAVSL
jgi:23S rRNA (cytidine1920-2'-O)/16S rRNA (cytidine1409-2'-O)-methyltransferase